MARKNKINEKKISKRKENIVIILLTVVFLISLYLGSLFVYPFGTFDNEGDAIGFRFTKIVLITLYPLLYLFSLLNNHGDITTFEILLMIIAVILYYFFLSKLLVGIFSKLISLYKKRFLFGLLLFVALSNIVLVSAVSDSNLVNNGLIKQVNVVDTKELLINLIPVDWDKVV